MLDIHYACEQLLKDKRKNNIYNRYPIRFLFTTLSNDSESEILELLKEMNEKYNNEITIVNLYDLLPFEDAWITKSQLINYVKNLTRDSKDYMILGFSELIRFYSREDLEAIIISFMTDIESTNAKNNRIYFVCFSLFDKISMELKTNNRNETINPIINLNSEKLVDGAISVYYANSVFESCLFKNRITTSSQWLSIYKSKKLDLSSGVVCISDTLVTLYEMAKPDNFVAIEKLDSYYKLLTTLFKVNFRKTTEKDFPELFWKSLFELCKKSNCFEIKNALLYGLNLNKMDSMSFIVKYKSANDNYIKYLLQLYLYEYPSDFDCPEYLTKIIEIIPDNTYDSIVKCIYTYFADYNLYDYSSRKYYLDIFEEKDIHKFSIEYKKAINELFANFLTFNLFSSSVKISGDDLFSLKIDELCTKYNTNEQYIKTIFKNFFNERLKNIITCKCTEDKALIINLLRNNLVELDDVKYVYADLVSYIGNIESPYLNYSSQWMARYLYEYRISKLYNRPTKYFKDYYINYTKQNDFLKWYYSEQWDYPINLLRDKEYDCLIVIDGAGGEFFDYIIDIIQKKNSSVIYANYAKCFLPSITSIHKIKYEDKFDEWITTFDSECIHSLFYKDANLIPKELETINEIISSLLDRYKEKKIAIIADHGCTVSGKIFNEQKKYSFEAEHEGRCIKITDNGIKESPDYFKFKTGESTYLISLSGVSLSDIPKREAHGGAMIEEVIVPCIIVSTHKDKYKNINHNIFVLSGKLSGLNRRISLKITPSISGIAPVLIEENGKEHKLVSEGNDVWDMCDDIDNIKTQNCKIRIQNATENVIIESTMGASIEGDGFDD